MSIFSRLFGTKPQPVSPQSEQAVLVYLDGQSLPTEVYEQNDLATLEDQLTEAIDSSALGEFDGNEMGPTEVVLYMYGPSAEALFEIIEPILRAYPLCAKSRVIVRQGGPGAKEREIRLP